jgi:hypothetical protein
LRGELAIRACFTQLRLTSLRKRRIHSHAAINVALNLTSRNARTTLAAFGQTRLIFWELVTAQCCDGGRNYAHMFKHQNFSLRVSTT